MSNPKLLLHLSLTKEQADRLHRLIAFKSFDSDLKDAYALSYRHFREDYNAFIQSHS